MSDILVLMQNMPSGTIAMLVVFIVLLLCGLGLPLPEEISLITAGYLVYLDMVELSTAMVVCMVGILLGDLALFMIGRTMGLTVFEHRWFKKVINRKRLRLSRHYFDQHGKRIIFYARFIAGIRAPIFLSAAILRMPITTFLMMDTLAALLSVPLSIYLAFYFGAEIEGIAKLLHNTKILVGVAIVLLVGGFLVYRFFKKRAENNALTATKIEEPKIEEIKVENE